MALDITNLEETTITTGLEGKILGWYGLNNTGKSYVASRLFPGKTLWLASEKGYNSISGMRKVDIDSWNDFRQVVSQLTVKNEKKREKVRAMYQCVVVDVADRLPNLATSYIISTYNTQNAEKSDFTPITELSGIPYGGGYAMLNKEMDTQINKLALSGYCIVLIFHDEIRKVKDGREEYEYIVPKNTFNKVGNALKDIPDFMIYLESQGVDEDGKALLSIGHCVQHKEYFARSRFTECPETISPFTADNLKETVRIACEREAEKQGVSTITYAEEEAQREKEKTEKKKSAAELIEEIKPIYGALRKAKLTAAVNKIVGDFLGYDENDKPNKISEANDSQVEALQYIYDKLVDLAEEKDISWEE